MVLVDRKVVVYWSILMIGVLLLAPSGSNMTQNDIPEVREGPGLGGDRGRQRELGSKSWFRVTKICPGPNRMVFNHFVCIWGHWDAL